ncbi:MAG TPA: hypothetical protein VLG08_11445 [Casimicrobiaceae bacterium]|nr:hypothetical protein [Casimicrobiaceae bacterium]
MIAVRGDCPGEAVQRSRNPFPVTQFAIDREAFLQELACARRLAHRVRRQPEPMQRAGHARPVAKLPADREAFVVESTSRFVVALVAMQVAERTKRVRDVPAVTERAKDGEAFLVQVARRHVVALHHREAREVDQRYGDAPAIALLAVDREAFLVERARRSIVALLVSQQALVVEDRADALPVTELPPDRQATCVGRLCGPVVALLPGQYAGPVERLGARDSVDTRRHLEKLRQPSAALGEIAANQPESRESARKPQPGFGVAAGPHRMGQSGAHVVVLGLQPIQPLALVASRQLRLGRLGECEEMREVPGMPTLLVGMHPRLLRCVRVHGIEQPIAGCGNTLLRNEQALVDERREKIEHAFGGDIIPGAYLLRGLEREAAGEDRRRAEQRLFGVAQQLVAPVDRGAQRLLARRERARPARQKHESLVESLVDVLH